MPELPTGTVTFVFTDIEGSTKLLHELGDAYADALAEHRRLLREAFARHGGVEVDTQGDAFFVAFARARDALAAAAEAQQALSAGPIRVRIGVHTGEPIVTAEGYVGMDVHKGARIAAAGHGGQVLVSQATRELAGTDDLRDLGEHRLKDLTAPERIYQLGSREFPLLKTLHQTNLPVQPTPLVGRERELVEVGELLRELRLVTLTGPGGAGKTRLAAQAAADAVDDFPHGVWWVSLGGLREPDHVESTIAQVVGATTQLADHLRSKTALLVLDNFEHVVGAAPAIAELLSEAPDLRVLATSRERLGLAAEQEYAVPPLAPRESVELFTIRARQLNQRFAPDQAIEQVCARLDGLPLAVELAAARVKVLSPTQILERLGRSLDLLTAGSRDAPARQQTLRATIEWSHDLLDDAERFVFARLGAFAGAFDLEAAEFVSGADIDTLAALVDKSLLRQNENRRFFMLETIREFARERLDAGSDANAVYRRHAEHFTRFAEGHLTSSFGWVAPDDVDWFDREHGNLHSALDWLSGQEGEFELEARLVDACHSYWLHRGQWREGRRRIESALGRLGAAPPFVRARALRQAAALALRHGDWPATKARAEEALAIQREHGIGGEEVPRTVVLLSIAETELGNRERGAELQEQAAAWAREAGDDGLLHLVLSTNGVFALAAGDLGRARELLTESVEIGRRTDRPDVHRSFDLVQLAFIDLAEGDLDAAAGGVREGLAVARSERRADTIVWAIEAAAVYAMALGSHADGVALLAAVDRLRDDFGMHDDDPFGGELRRHAIAAARAQLGDAAFRQARGGGAGVSLDEAAERAAALVA